MKASVTALRFTLAILFSLSVAGTVQAQPKFDTGQGNGGNNGPAGLPHGSPPSPSLKQTPAPGNPLKANPFPNSGMPSFNGSQMPKKPAGPTILQGSRLHKSGPQPTIQHFPHSLGLKDRNHNPRFRQSR